MRPFTRLRLRRPGGAIAAPPLPPAGGYGQCRATAASTGRRCRLDVGPDGYCGHFGHRPPPPTPRAA